MTNFPNEVPAMLNSAMSREELDHYWNLGLQMIMETGGTPLIRMGAAALELEYRRDVFRKLIELFVAEGDGWSLHLARMMKGIDYLRQGKAPAGAMR